MTLANYLAKIFSIALLTLSVGIFSSYAVEVSKPQVEFTTPLGSFVVTLEPELAPATVANFLNYVESGFYNGSIFHRVIPGFMVQGGGFSATMEQLPTQEPIQNEADNALLNTVGSIAMARTNMPHSATSQFFINVADNDFLNHRAKNNTGWGYAVFGRVTEGMETIKQIEAVKTGVRGPYRDVPVDVVTITKATLR